MRRIRSRYSDLSLGSTFRGSHLHPAGCATTRSSNFKSLLHFFISRSRHRTLSNASYCFNSSSLASCPASLLKLLQTLDPLEKLLTTSQICMNKANLFIDFLLFINRASRSNSFSSLFPMLIICTLGTATCAASTESLDIAVDISREISSSRFAVGPGSCVGGRLRLRAAIRVVIANCVSVCIDTLLDSC